MILIKLLQLEAMMIVVVDDRATVTDAFARAFAREGVTAAGFIAVEFHDWVVTAPDDDVHAIEAVLIGECRNEEDLAEVIRRRCSAALIAVKDGRSLARTLELFAGGMDDVVEKPVHVRELLARIAAIARRARCPARADAERETIMVFCNGREPLVEGAPLFVPRRELRVLEVLMAARPRRMTKTEIFNAVYGPFDCEVDESVVESHISRLRRRLRGRLNYDPIESRRHLGYRIRTDASDGGTASQDTRRAFGQ